MEGNLLHGSAFITGAASGIGQETAFAFAKHGIQRLALADANRSNLLATASTIKAQYPDAEVVSLELDVCDENAVESCVAEAVKRFGRIDVGVNVAGIAGEIKSTVESDEADWAKVIDINLNGVWRCQRAELRAMLKQENLGRREGRGTIVNVSSMYGIIGSPPYMHASPYTASKHGVLGLTKSDATTYAEQGVRINAICPGYVNIPLLAPVIASGAMDPEIAKTPMKRVADVEEIADSIVFLASSMSSFMTGAALVVDGGYTAN